jgi:hypothetical protein
MNWLFHTAPLGQDEWLLALAGGMVVYIVIGMEKFIRGRIARRRPAPGAVRVPRGEERGLPAPQETLALSRRALANSRWALGLAAFALLLSMAMAMLGFLQWYGQ